MEKLGIVKIWNSRQMEKLGIVKIWNSRTVKTGKFWTRDLNQRWNVRRETERARKKLCYLMRMENDIEIYTSSTLEL